MSEEARRHWDERYADLGGAPAGDHSPLPLFAHVEDQFPTSGTAFEVACGRGRGATWLASRGMHVWGIDVSPVAVELASDHARSSGFADHCRFDVYDLDRGLPDGEPVDLVVCHLFRDAALDDALINRVKSGGLLAVACLSEVDHGAGRFRSKPGELTSAFAALEAIDSGEADGHAWFLGRR